MLEQFSASTIRFLLEYKDFIYIIVFFSALLECIPLAGAFFPGQAIIVVCGILLATHPEFSWPVILFAASAGAIVGDYAGFWIGARFGHAWLEKKYAGIDDVLAEMRRSLRRYWFFSVIGGRFNNITRSFMPIIAGSGGMDKRQFLVANSIGGVLWAGASLGIGYGLGAGYQFARELLSTKVEIIIGIILIIWLVVLVFKIGKKTKEEQSTAKETIKTVNAVKEEAVKKTTKKTIQRKNTHNKQ